MWFPARKTSSRIWVAINLLVELFYTDMPVLETDDRLGGRTVMWLPDFLGWVDYFIFLLMVIRCTLCKQEIRY